MAQRIRHSKIIQLTEYRQRSSLNLGDLHLFRDTEKNLRNIDKHGISFETAALVFTDENRIEIYDEWHGDNEDRFITVGMVDQILFVVYTEREGDIRLISARIATLVERNMYYGS